ncbi:hypothetical protein [Ensifer sesbaniae]|uniref:hypothetical protein n=1 Tax=Ensifer sesbaniae TaxID=1214071 RepID=UPI0015699908|nr:hypothetical protein [Ensifer sesbaniae]NRQ13439.1 hypothetical protein [Ensifer sesbaniae]
MARGELKTIKFQMMLSESEAKTLDEWAEHHGFKSRAEVIRRMCQLALLTDERASSIARKLRNLDFLATRFLKQVETAKTGFSNKRSRMTDRLAESAEFYSEEIFDQIGEINIDLDLILGTTLEMRSRRPLDEVVDQLRQDRIRIQETSEAFRVARQNKREERKRLQGVDFVELQNRMEAIIRRSPDLDLAQQAAHEEVNRWLDSAKAKKEEIEKREQERDVYLAERRKQQAARTQDESDGDV